MEYLIYFIFTVLFSFFANKKSLMPNYTGNSHQKFLNTQNVPLIGGFIFLLSLIFISLNKDSLNIFFYILIFLIGFLSDSKKLSSPKFRLILQLLIIIFFVVYFDIHVTPTRIELVDKFLDNNQLSLIFTIFCFLVLINGSNFIDGLNGLLLGYFLIVFLNLDKADISISVGFSYSEINFLIFSLILILILNLLNYFFLGDGGSYLIAIFFGYLLISIYNKSSDISPYYIILLLWYPCFEILFSFLRKYLCNKSPMKPDNQHLHQLLFSYYKKKFTSFNKYYVNILSSISINIFNLLIINLASTNPNLTTLQIKLIFFAVIIYFLTYFCLSKNLKLKLKE